MNNVIRSAGIASATIFGLTMGGDARVSPGAAEAKPTCWQQDMSVRIDTLGRQITRLAHAHARSRGDTRITPYASAVRFTIGDRMITLNTAVEEPGVPGPDHRRQVGALTLNFDRATNVTNITLYDHSDPAGCDENATDVTWVEKNRPHYNTGDNLNKYPEDFPGATGQSELNATTAHCTAENALAQLERAAKEAAANSPLSELTDPSKPC